MVAMVTGEIPSTYPARERPSTPINQTTRLLCASALIKQGFSELVFNTLCVPRVEAIAPAPGVNLVLLARHAAFAMRERRNTHVMLCVLLAGMVVPITGLLVLPDLPGLWASMVLGLVIAAKVCVVRNDVGLARRATRLVDSSQVDNGFGTGLVDRDQEARLATVNDANLSIYSWTRAGDPFPGLGQRLDARVLQPIAIDEPKDEDRPVTPVTTSTLLQHLARTMPQHVKVADTTDSYWVHTMLYLAGTAVRYVPGLLRDRHGPPALHVSEDMLDNTADHPSRVTRTYLRAQIIGHGGQVVTTLGVSATVEPNDLLIDVAVHTLRPIHDVYHDADRLPRSPMDLVWALTWRAGLLPGLLGAPGRALRTRKLLQDSREVARLTPEQMLAFGTQDFYGARLGLREITSYNSTFDFNQRADAVRQGHVLMIGVLDEVIAYLDGCNIDTSALLEQQQSIINNYIDASTNHVKGQYINGGAGGIKVGGDFTATHDSAPNLTKKNKPGADT